MESSIITSTIGSELCDEKTSQVMRWLSEAEGGEKAEFAVARLFENGVLGENTKGFLHVLLEKEFPGDRTDLEFAPDKIYALVSEAFTGTQMYLVTPQTFLSNFLTFNSDTLTINTEMLSRLAYIVSYPYFPEMIDEWLAISLQQGKHEIPKREFQKFLSQTDHTVIRYSSDDELHAYLAPLYEFYGVKTLSGEIVLSFFNDKKLIIPPMYGQEQFTPEEMAAALKDAVLALPPVKDYAPIPEYDSFLQELREIGVVLPPPNHANEKEKNIALPPIEMFISKKLREKCLEKIFHGNKNEYERMIALLNSTSDYSQAELNLQTLLGIHKVKSDSKTANRLHDVLRMRFGMQVEIIAEA